MLIISKAVEIFVEIFEWNIRFWSGFYSTYLWRANCDQAKNIDIFLDEMNEIKVCSINTGSRWCLPTHKGYMPKSCECLQGDEQYKNRKHPNGNSACILNLCYVYVCQNLQTKKYCSTPFSSINGIKCLSVDVLIVNFMANKKPYQLTRNIISTEFRMKIAK